MCHAQLGNTAGSPLDSYHTQLASLINGVFTAGRVAVAQVACLPTAGVRPAVGNRAVFPYTDSHGTLPSGLFLYFPETRTCDVAQRKVAHPFRTRLQIRAKL